MTTPLEQYAADHRRLLQAAGRLAGFADPIAVELDEFQTPLVKAARRGPPMPLDGVLVRDWDPDCRRTASGLRIGMRLYEIDGVRFARVSFLHDNELNCSGLDFTAVDRKDYRRLYRIALRRRLKQQPAGAAPVLPQTQLDLLWKNTIGYLDRDNLARIRAYGGRARRGVLLTGAPGNGKTMACRWVLEECRRRCWEYHLVTPDAYRNARKKENVEKLFSVERRGVVFFDDMDLALRDRDTVEETEDQAVFLSTLDGLNVQEGVVFVFTTNCPLDLIDRALKRPGRIDLALHFKAPNAALRRRLLARWHADILAGIDVDQAVASTDGCSFADIEELKNLLVLQYMDGGAWDWQWALRQFAENRGELLVGPQRHVGFAANGRKTALGFGRERVE
ncbi:MAG TPA: ATP-binding protein [Gemmataceae bacterium]|nr:ATP-binding protein [Gemmataceae bacterium]